MELNDTERRNTEARDAWNQNASFWDERMGEGNDWHLLLVWPPTVRMLSVRSGERVLDVACGNGLASRRMAEAGVKVVAFDGSDEMIAHARARKSAHDDKIDYRVIDATDEKQLLDLGENSFDAAVCNMALMDISTIDPLMGAVARLLRPGGRFVWSTTHPCFNGRHTRAVETTENGELRHVFSVKVSEYLTPGIAHGRTHADSPTAHPMFHRSFQDLLGAGFRAGLVVDALSESAYPEGYGGEKPSTSWDHYSEIPPVLVVRMRHSAE